jgi:trypsin
MTVKRDRGRLAAAFAAAAVVLAIALPAGAGADVQPRVVGGSYTNISAYPWQAALVYNPSKVGGNAANRQICGGSLIAPQIVITAAHCVFDTDPDCGILCLNDPGGDGTVKADANDFDVVLGRTTLSTTEGAEVTLKAISYDAGFAPGPDGVGPNDAAFLVLNSPSGQPQIKLAGPSETAIWTVGSPTQVSGYGATSQGGSASNTLKVATVPILPDSNCSNPYGSTYVPSSMVCAGYLAGGTDSCNGDSGGPLQAPAVGGIFRLVGVVSFGDGCAQPGFPGVYSRVGSGSPGTLFNRVVNDVAALESTNGLPHTDIVGSGALPLGAPAPVAKKCKKHKKLNKKTGKCVKKKKKRKRNRRK